LPLADLLRRSMYSRLAGYGDVHDAQRLSQDPTFRLVGSEKIGKGGAALTSRLQSFETEVLTQEENLAGLAAMNRELIATAGSYLTRRSFEAMLGKIAALASPAGWARPDVSGRAADRANFKRGAGRGRKCLRGIDRQRGSPQARLWHSRQRRVCRFQTLRFFVSELSESLSVTSVAPLSIQWWGEVSGCGRALLTPC
jgi:hypothetical protein